MNNACKRWAEAEFGQAQLGDERRTGRLVSMGASAAYRPAGTITKTFSTDAEREAAFRFMENEDISHEEIARSSHQGTVTRCRGYNFVYVPVDQSSIEVVDKKEAKGFGPVGSRETTTRGLEAMSALSVSPTGVVLGLCGQSWWCRSDEPSPGWKNDNRPWKERESDLWIRVMSQSKQLFETYAPATAPWFQMDRGADFWRVFQFGIEQNQKLTVRSVHDRRLETEEQDPLLNKLWPVLRRQRIAGRFQVKLPREKLRAARTKTLQVRFLPVCLRMTIKGRNNFPAELYAVHVRQAGKLRHGEERIEWLLLTTVAVSNFRGARAVVEGYTQRWKVEEFHRVWKSGKCNVERSQLRSPEAFKKWATILASVAVRIEQLKQLSRSRPDAPAEELLSRSEIDAAIILSETKKWKVGDSLTLKEAVDLIAKIGGFTGYKSSGGPPGSIVLGRGFAEVLVASKVVEKIGEKCD